MKTKWYIALDNIGPYIDPLLGERYKFLKGEPTTREKVFDKMPDITEEEYARCFRPATEEEEVNGEFYWDGEQYILNRETKHMKSIKEKADEYAKDYLFSPLPQRAPNVHFEKGANYVLECIEDIIVNNEDNSLNMARCLVDCIEQLKK